MKGGGLAMTTLTRHCEEAQPTRQSSRNASVVARASARQPRINVRGVTKTGLNCLSTMEMT